MNSDVSQPYEDRTCVTSLAGSGIDPSQKANFRMRFQTGELKAGGRKKSAFSNPFDCDFAMQSGNRLYDSDQTLRAYPERLIAVDRETGNRSILSPFHPALPGAGIWANLELIQPSHEN